MVYMRFLHITQGMAPFGLDAQSCRTLMLSTHLFLEHERL